MTAHTPLDRRARSGATLTVGALLATAIVTGPSAVTPAAADVVQTSATKICTLQDPRITESSGLATSYYRRGRLWTANDSGGGTTLYAVNSTSGRTVRTFELAGAEHRDWEGMARSVIGGVSHLYVGDIGGHRTNVFVHRFREPKPGRGSGNITRYRTYELRYPDGAHNAEAIMVHPRSHRIYVVSKVKGANGAIYRAPLSPSTRHVNRLQRVRSAPPGMADAVFLRQGGFVLRGYVNGWYFPSMTADPRLFALPVKGESIAQAVNRRNVFVGSERVRSPIWRVRLP